MRLLKGRQAVLGVVLLLVVIGIGMAVSARNGASAPAGTAAIAPRPVAIGVDAVAGHVLVVSGNDLVRRGSVSMLDARSGHVLLTTPVGVDARAITVDSVTGRAFVLNGGSSDSNLNQTGKGSISVLDTRTGRVLATVPLRMPGRAVALDHAAGHLFVATGYAGRGQVEMLDSHAWRVLQRTTVGFIPYALAVDERTGRVFVANHGFGGGHGAGVSVIDARSGRLLRTVPLRQDPNAIAVDQRTDRVFVTGGTAFSTGANGLSMLDARDGHLIGSVNVGPDPLNVAVDERTGRVFIPNNAAAIVMLDARTGRLLHSARMDTYLDPLAQMAVDPQAGRVWVTNTGQTYVLDGTTGRLLGAIRAPSATVTTDARTGHIFIAGIDRSTENSPGSTLWHGIQSWFGYQSCDGCGKPDGATQPGVVTMVNGGP